MAFQAGPLLDRVVCRCVGAGLPAASRRWRRRGREHAACGRGRCETQLVHVRDCWDESRLAKPDIVFFGEDLPQRFYELEDDLRQCDLLIVAGTSLQVTQ